jgi:hypothetical protein
VKAASAKQRRLHEPDEFARRTPAEFIAEVRSTGERVAACNDEVLRRAAEKFKAKEKLEQACVPRKLVVTLGGKVVSSEQEETCRPEK